MNLTYVEESWLPRLAWLLELPRDAAAATVHHGSWVETQPGFFCDGAWDGPFAEGGFDQAQASATSGGACRPGSILLCTPSHPLQAVYVYTDGQV